MKSQLPPKLVDHVQRFLIWWGLVKQAFPPLWKAGANFAPLVMSRCDICEKPKTWFWFPAGDHTQCERLETDAGT